MKIKLTSFERVVIPKIELTNAETGEKMQNIELGKSDQIQAEITYANPEQKFYYIGDTTEIDVGKKSKDKKKKNTITSRRDWKIEECIREHVKGITGVLREYYRDGHTLWDGPPSAEREDLVMDLFYRINGVRFDEDEPNDGPEELSEGESVASE